MDDSETKFKKEPGEKFLLAVILVKAVYEMLKSVRKKGEAAAIGFGLIAYGAKEKLVAKKK